MIVELFGPPGVGKTTFAHALTARLRERGYVVAPMLSLRPHEWPAPTGCGEPPSRRSAAPLVRARRALGDLLATAGRLCAHPHERAAVSALIGAMPPRNIVWSLKSYQYLLRLDRSWRLGAAGADVALFDQGFVQAICTLALLHRSVDAGLLARALDAAPQADFLIRLDAPQEILAARLRERARRQNKIEHRLEFDLATNLKAIHIVEALHLVLERRGRRIACVRSTDHDALSEALTRIENEIAAALAAGGGRRPDESASLYVNASSCATG